MLDLRPAEEKRFKTASLEIQALDLQRILKSPSARCSHQIFVQVRRLSAK